MQKPVFQQQPFKFPNKTKVEMKLPTENLTEQQSEGYGFYQWCSGKKYKGKTFYDIANEGDFGYLKWILKPKKPFKDGQVYKLHPTCTDHVQAALTTEGSNAKWEKKTEEQFQIKYTWYEANEGNDHFKGPVIVMWYCTNCSKHKNKDCFVNQYSPCKMCWKNTETLSEFQIQ